MHAGIRRVAESKRVRRTDDERYTDLFDVCGGFLSSYTHPHLDIRVSICFASLTTKLCSCESARVRAWKTFSGFRARRTSVPFVLDVLSPTPHPRTLLQSSPNTTEFLIPQSLYCRYPNRTFYVCLFSLPLIPKFSPCSDRPT